MRLGQQFVYKIADVGPVPPIFDFIMKHGPVDRREAYATFNMGAGFAVFVPAADAPRTVRLAQSLRHTAWVAGAVEKQGDRKAVEIVPLDVTFESDTLQVR
jgi:phosphoribosylformylglycinamidine cyclo-ligase